MLSGKEGPSRVRRGVEHVMSPRDGVCLCDSSDSKLYRDSVCKFDIRALVEPFSFGHGLSSVTWMRRIGIIQLELLIGIMGTVTLTSMRIFEFTGIFNLNTSPSCLRTEPPVELEPNDEGAYALFCMVNKNIIIMNIGKIYVFL